MRKSEYLRTYSYEADDDLDKDALSFLNLRLRYDPYSQTAAEDYETLVSHLREYDLLGMLAREMRKSRVHQQLTKKLLHAARFIDDDVVDSAAITIAESFRSLLTVFSSVASLLLSFVQRIKPDTKLFVERKIAILLEGDDAPNLLELHRMIAVRLLASLGGKSSETENVIWRQYSFQNSVLVQKECIWSLTRLRKSDLLRPLLDRFDRSSQWERRAMLAATFSIEADGAAIRRHFAHRLSPLEDLVVEWCESRNGRLFEEVET
jgi:hypothetical protein